MILVLCLLIYLAYAYCTSIVLERCGQTGWWGYVPGLNFIGLVRAAGRSSWLVLLVLIPLANLILHVVVWMEIAKRLGRSFEFGLGLTFLPVIFLPLAALQT